MSTPSARPTSTGPILTQGALQTRSFTKVLLVLLAVVLVLGGGMFWLESRQTSQEEKKSTTRQHVILRPKTEQDDWRAKEGSRVEELNRTIQNFAAGDQDHP